LLPAADAFRERVERGQSGVLDCDQERLEPPLGVRSVARPVDLAEAFLRLSEVS
jgi:hypothetical protein